MSLITIGKDNRAEAFNKVLLSPWYLYSKLDMEVGYATPGMLRYLLKALKNKHLPKKKRTINIYIGMDIGNRKEKDLHQFYEIQKAKDNNFDINVYFNNQENIQENHTKNYFYSKSGIPEILYTGSANFSLNVWRVKTKGKTQFNNLTETSDPKDIKQQWERFKSSSYYTSVVDYINQKRNRHVNYSTEKVFHDNEDFQKSSPESASFKKKMTKEEYEEYWGNKRKAKEKEFERQRRERAEEIRSRKAREEIEREEAERLKRKNKEVEEEMKEERRQKRKEKEAERELEEEKTMRITVGWAAIFGGIMFTCFYPHLAMWIAISFVILYIVSKRM